LRQLGIHTVLTFLPSKIRFGNIPLSSRWNCGWGEGRGIELMAGLSRRDWPYVQMSLR